MNRLIELKSDKGVAGNRRWFSSSEIDLIIWTDDDRLVTAFEFYYDKAINEHVLVWRSESGFSHLAVDDGEQKPVLNYKASPILLPDGFYDAERIMALFERLQTELPAELADGVCQKLRRLASG